MRRPAGRPSGDREPSSSPSAGSIRHELPTPSSPVRMAATRVPSQPISSAVPSGCSGRPHVDAARGAVVGIGGHNPDLAAGAALGRHLAGEPVAVGGVHDPQSPAPQRAVRHPAMSSPASRARNAGPPAGNHRRRPGARTPSRPATATLRSWCAPSALINISLPWPARLSAVLTRCVLCACSTQVPCSHEVGMTNTPRGDGPSRPSRWAPATRHTRIRRMRTRPDTTPPTRPRRRPTPPGSCRPTPPMATTRTRPASTGRAVPAPGSTGRRTRRVSRRKIRHRQVAPLAVGGGRRRGASRRRPGDRTGGRQQLEAGDGRRAAADAGAELDHHAGRRRRRSVADAAAAPDRARCRPRAPRRPASRRLPAIPRRWSTRSTAPAGRSTSPTSTRATCCRPSSTSCCRGARKSNCPAPQAIRRASRSSTSAAQVTCSVTISGVQVEANTGNGLTICTALR